MFKLNLNPFGLILWILYTCIICGSIARCTQNRLYIREKNSSCYISDVTEHYYTITACTVTTTMATTTFTFCYFCCRGCFSSFCHSTTLNTFVPFLLNFLSSFFMEIFLFHLVFFSIMVEPFIIDFQAFFSLLFPCYLHRMRFFSFTCCSCFVLLLLPSRPSLSSLISTSLVGTNRKCSSLLLFQIYPNNNFIQRLLWLSSISSKKEKKIVQSWKAK